MSPEPVEVTEIVAPCVVGFMILLPDPIPIPPKATWHTVTEERVPELDGIPYSPQAGSEPLGGVAEASNFVSFRFWQVVDDSTEVVTHESKLIERAFDAMHPSARTEGAGTDADRPDCDSGARYRTVVEAVTFLSEHPTDVSPLDRCLEALSKFHRAYRVIAPRPVPELTLKRLFPMVLTFRRRIVETEVTPYGIVILEDGSFADTGGYVDGIGPEIFDQVAECQNRLDQHDPTIRYAECRTDAAYALHGIGSFRDAIIHLGIACEVLFDGLLGMLMWEEGRSVEEAAQVFSGTITTRIKNEFHVRLGGTWRLDRGELGRWGKCVADTRNRVVHAGYRPGGQEAFEAERAADDLRDFVARRLSAKGKTYPFTNCTFFGDGPVPPGVPTLNKAARTWLATNRNSLDAKRAEHKVWREAVDAAVSRRSRL